MIIPLGVDVPMECRPFVNWLMVGGMIYRWKNPPAATAPLQYADYLNEQAWKNENQYDAPKIPLYPQAGSAESEFIQFTCVYGKNIKTSVKNAGRTGKCPKCRNPIKIPKP